MSTTEAVIAALDACEAGRLRSLEAALAAKPANPTLLREMRISLAQQRRRSATLSSPALVREVPEP
ncbi:MAG TPA: hypothetical protein VMU75_08625 [Acidimicrobiales bacterium]|nr:hypothetical protein [Acidimicrobiales bacterium]